MSKSQAPQATANRVDDYAPWNGGDNTTKMNVHRLRTAAAHLGRRASRRLVGLATRATPSATVLGPPGPSPESGGRARQSKASAGRAVLALVTVTLVALELLAAAPRASAVSAVTPEAGGHMGLGGQAVAPGSVWGSTEQVPGTAALNTGGYGITDAVSCPSPGNCSAAGSYDSASAGLEAFVVNQANGTWGDAQGVPGMTSIRSMSCASAGNCTAGGVYANATYNQIAGVVSETNGKWGSAEEIPGITTLDHSFLAAEVTSVSCPTLGDCVAVRVVGGAGLFR